jgi:hypothetical protein
MASRLQLQKALKDLEIMNVYFQPPENVKLKFPCIVYKFTKFETEHAAVFSLYESQCRELSRLRALNPAAFSGFRSIRHLVAVGRFAEAERELTGIAAAAGSGSQAEDALEKARAFIRTGRENSETIAKYLKLVEEWRFDSGLFRGSFDSTGGKPQETMLWMFLMFVVLTELTVSFMILGVLC